MASATAHAKAAPAKAAPTKAVAPAKPHDSNAAGPIKTQPVSRTVMAGDTVVFSVAAFGKNASGHVSYQWRKDSTRLVGKTNRSLVIANAQESDEGIYSVRVSNGAIFVASKGATLTVNHPENPPPVTPEIVWLEDSDSASYQNAGYHFTQFGTNPWQNGWPWLDFSWNPAPYSGDEAHGSSHAQRHQHWFGDSTHTLPVVTNDVLFAYVYLDPVSTPSEIMIQWQTPDRSFEHRAYWGADLVQDWGTNNTVSRRKIGAMPPAGQWVKLEVPAGLVGLEGEEISGIALTTYGGQSTWDRAGKNGGLE